MDATPCVVIDTGSASVKAGYSGEDIPRTVFPSVLPDEKPVVSEGESVPVGISRSSGRKPEAIEWHPGISSYHPIRRGFVEESSWEKLEQLWDYTFGEELNAYPEGNAANGPMMTGTSVLLTETPGMPASSRQRIAQIMFETFKVPALCFFNSSSLSLFASGRTRGIVLECGAGVSHAVPVFEGFALAHAIRRAEIAGSDVTSSLAGELNSQGLDRTLNMDVLRDIKERLCFVNGLRASQQTPTLLGGDIEYELPDGSMVQIAGECRAKAPEILFTRDAERTPLQQLVVQSIGMCDRDLQTDLRESVVLAGGTTMLPGFCSRIKEELVKAYPAESVRVVPGPNPCGTAERGYNSQRKHASWIGGSMFASLDTFKEIRVMKQEWEDDESAIHRKSF